MLRNAGQKYGLGLLWAGAVVTLAVGCGGQSASSNTPVQRTPEEQKQMDDYYKQMQQQHPQR